MGREYEPPEPDQPVLPYRSISKPNGLVPSVLELIDPTKFSNVLVGS